MKKCILFLYALIIFSAAHSQSWVLNGNTGTNPQFDFVGTKDNQPLLFRINNLFSGKIDSAAGLTFFGYRAGSNMERGFNNVALGFKALFSTNHGNSNTATGYSSLFSNTTGNDNTAQGAQSLYANTSGYSNTANGKFALYSNTTGYNNTAAGGNALRSNTTGRENTANGCRALENNTIGTHNTASGYVALTSNTNGIYNAAYGYGALQLNTTGNFNTANGAISLYYNTTGSANTACGLQALFTNSTGSENTADGDGALSLNSTGSSNTAVGAVALYNNRTSWYNTALGFRAADSYNVGWNNTFLGANSDANQASLYNGIAVGESATFTASSQARIGNSSTTSIGGYVGWTNISDARYKKQVKENVIGLDFILKLRPVTYQLDVPGIRKTLGEGHGKETDEFSKKAIAEKEKLVFSGFLAQEVEAAAKQTGYDFSGVDKPKNENDFYGLRYAEFVVPLVKAVQEQQQQITVMKTEISLLKEQNKMLQEYIKSQRSITIRGGN